MWGGGMSDRELSIFCLALAAGVLLGVLFPYIAKL